MVKGVTDGYEKKLALVGVGYRAQAAGESSIYRWAFASGGAQDAQRRRRKRRCQTEIVSGIDSSRSGRSPPDSAPTGPPEPYKGKGVRYVGGGS